MRGQDTVKLFRLLELTRLQPQTGYVLRGVSRADLGNLAEHHFLVAMFALQIAKLIQEAGGKLNVERVLEISLAHDLGELFGSDIAMPYAKANPKARAAAKAFETVNQAFLVEHYFGDEYNEIFAEAREPKTDEGFIAKIADYLEVAHYKLHLRLLTPNDLTMAEKHLSSLTKKIHSRKTRAVLITFAQGWLKDLNGVQQSNELFEQDKI